MASRHLLQELHVALDLSVKLGLLRLQLREELRILRIKRLDALLQCAILGLSGSHSLFCRGVDSFLDSSLVYARLVASLERSRCRAKHGGTL